VVLDRMPGDPQEITYTTSVDPTIERFSVEEMYKSFSDFASPLTRAIYPPSIADIFTKVESSG
jgi:hypothetical protein